LTATRRSVVKYDMAYKAPQKMGFSAVEEGHGIHLPQSKQLYTSRTIHRTNTQDLEMDME
jgi:hypothetical protein